MKIFAMLYATLTKYAGGTVMHQPMEIEIHDGATLNDLYQHLRIPHKEVKTAFVNSTMQPPEYRLSEGDEVGIFPPVGGG
jgi:molybdopterin converting factor small subunit